MLDGLVLYFPSSFQVLSKITKIYRTVTTPTQPQNKRNLTQHDDFAHHPLPPPPPTHTQLPSQEASNRGQLQQQPNKTTLTTISLNSFRNFKKYQIPFKIFLNYFKIQSEFILNSFISSCPLKFL